MRSPRRSEHFVYTQVRGVHSPFTVPHKRGKAGANGGNRGRHSVPRSTQISGRQRRPNRWFLIVHHRCALGGPEGGGGGQGLFSTPGTKDSARTCVRRDRTIRGCRVARPAGPLTAPGPGGGTCRRGRWGGGGMKQRIQSSRIPPCHRQTCHSRLPGQPAHSGCGSY